MVAIDLPPWTILSYILLGSILGMIGQGIRVVVGLKKAQADAEATKKIFLGINGLTPSSL